MRRGWWSGRPLRTRLVVSSIALLAVVCGVIALVTTLALQAFLGDQLDGRVREAAERSRAAAHAADLPGGPPAGGVTFLMKPGTDAKTVGARIHEGSVSGAGVLDTSLPPRLRTLSAAQAASAASVPPDGEPHTRSIPGLGEYRMMALVDDLGDGDTLITGLPTAAVQDTVGQLIAVEVVVAVCGLVAAGLAGAAIVKLALRPLRRVAETATRVSEQTLHTGEVGTLERVPAADTDPGTEAGQVGAALNRLLDTVSSALAARHASETRVRQFVADASHELRTPLASIRGYAELTRRGGELVPPDTAHALRRVECEAARMSALVEDLLLLARLDSGRPLDPALVDLSPLVVDAVSDARAAGPGHHWRLDLPDAPVTALVDPARLHQVLANLLANARTHTPPGTTVTASAEDPPGAQVVLRVADDGPGIDPGVLPDVFERFARGDTSRSRAAGSTGLGLAIVAAVVTAHRGSVEVSSVPGRTVFTVRLPAGRPPAGG